MTLPPSDTPLTDAALTKCIRHGSSDYEAVITVARTLERELQSLRAGVVEWMPIETRPMDGSSYLVANSKGQVAPYIRGVIHNNVGTAQDWQYGEAITLWCPFPSPSSKSEVSVSSQPKPE